MGAGETTSLDPYEPVELPWIKVPACWNIRESLLACPRHCLHPQGRGEGGAGRGMFAAAAAAGALPLGAPWVQRGRTACPRLGSSRSPRQRRHRGCREFSACDRLTALQAEMLEPREGCREWSSSPLLTSSPHVAGAHAAAAGGRWATGFSLWLPESCEPAGEPETVSRDSDFSWVKLALKNPRLQRGNLVFLLLSFSKVVLTCSFLQLEGKKLLQEGRDHMIPGAEVWREEEMRCKAQVTGQARNLEVLKHTLHTDPSLAGCQTFSLPLLTWKSNKQGPKHKLRTYPKAHCAPEKDSHGLNGRSGLSQAGLLVKFCNCNPSKYKNSLSFSWRYRILPSIGLTIPTIFIWYTLMEPVMPL